MSDTGNKNSKKGKTDFTHQDWEPVVVRKSAAQKKKEGKKVTGPVSRKFTGGKNSQTSNDVPARKIEDDDAPRQKKKVNPKLKTEVVQARAAKKWKQKDLARMANVQLKVVQDIEKGLMPNQAHLNRIGKALGKQFKKTA